MKFCANCGTQLEDSVRFCASCGMAVTAPQPAAVTQPAPEQTYRQQEYQQPIPAWRQHQPNSNQAAAPIPGKAAKPKRKIPRFAKILMIVAGVGIAVSLVLTLVVLPGILKTTAVLDYYEIMDDQVPSVKLALGEERKVTGADTAVNTSGVHTKTFSYAVSSGQGMEMAAYAGYLRQEDGFEFITDADFAAAAGNAVQLARNSVKDGNMVVVQLDWDKSGYTVSLMWGAGEVTPLVSDNPPDSPAEESDVENSMEYTVQDESIPSIAAVLEETREVADTMTDSSNGATVVSVRYSVPGTGQGLELFEYTTYLRNEEGFIYLTDVDFNTSTGHVQMGKNSSREDYALIVDLIWDADGYTVTLAQTPGSVTVD